MRIRVLTLTLAFLLLASALTAAPQFAPGRLIVEFKQSPTALSSYESSLAGLWQIVPLFPESGRTTTSSRFSAAVYSFTFADDSLLAAAEQVLLVDPRVAYVERDPLMQLFSDSLFSNQWGLANEGQEYLGIERISGIQNDTVAIKRGLPGADINWPADAALAEPHHRPILAIIDTGVDYLHPDLWKNVWVNEQEIPENGRDDDFNGLVDDVYGYDFSGDSTVLTGIEPDPDPRDEIGHGTHVAGIVAALADNEIGIRGVAPHARIMCMKMFPNAFASVSAQAIIYAVENGAAVINASWGGPYYSSILDEAIQFAREQGVVFVAASGNSGENTRFYPASFDHVLTVGASNSADEVTFFSSFGSWVDLVAPGRDILSLRGAGTDLYAGAGEPGVRIVADDYMLADGTSMAAPHVVGALGLLLSLSPGISPDSARLLLEHTADDFVDPYADGTSLPGFDNYSGWGRINIGRALGLTNGDYVEIESPAYGSRHSGEIAFVGSAVAVGRQFELLVRPKSDDRWLLLASGSAAHTRDTLAIWDSGDYDGLTEIMLRLDNQLEFVSQIRLTNNAQVELLAPVAGDTIFSSAPIIGSASHAAFEKFELTYLSDDPPGGVYPVHASTRITYREELLDWKVGPIPPGTGRLRLRVFASGEVLETETPIIIKSLLSAGFPLAPQARPGLAMVAGNLDDEPYPEIVSGADAAIIIIHPDEMRLEEWQPDFGRNFSSAPALYDFDGDSRAEIVAVSDSGIAVLYGDGSFAPGWPKLVSTGNMFNSLPTPLITDLNNDGEMEILIANRSGDILCWDFDGTSYFRTSNGLFARLVDRLAFSLFGGSAVPFLFAYDFDGDGYRDVGALYPVSGATGGLFMLSGRNGQPLFPAQGKLVRQLDDVFGGVLADFDGDGQPEIGFTHWFGGGSFLMGVSICEADGSYLPGWPKLFYDKPQWLAAYPAAADLDGDSLPELVCTFSALDGGEVYVWRGDGRPWLESELGRNDGLLAGVETSLGPPLVVDIDADGELEILCRGGALFWGKYERIHAWKLDGTAARNWPSFTFADPATVTYSPFVPLVGDFDLDGKLELAMGSSDRKVYHWDLPTDATAEAIGWGGFLHDPRHTGLLPFEPKIVEPTPAAPLPTRLHVGQNYPNPFNGETVFEVYLPVAVQVKLDVYNILGQRVVNLADRLLPAGVHQFVWDGRGANGAELASGVYFFRLSDGETTLTRKSLYLK